MGYSVVLVHKMHPVQTSTKLRLVHTKRLYLCRIGLNICFVSFMINPDLLSAVGGSWNPGTNTSS